MGSISPDETFEERDQRENLERFFGSYSAEVKNKLLSKNLSKPSGLFEVFNTKVKNSLLAKNKIAIQSDLSESSEDIRNALISKNVVKSSDLEQKSQDIRKGLISKNDLLQSNIQLEHTATVSRNNLLSKNDTETPNEQLEKQSNTIREQLLSKNIGSSANLSHASELEKNRLLSKNITNSDIDIETIADSIRKQLLSKNVEINSENVEKTSQILREKLLSHNGINNSDIEKQSLALLDNNKSKNVTKHTDLILENIAEEVRNDLLSKNKSGNIDIMEFSSALLNNLLSKNKANNVDLEDISGKFRDKSVSQNVHKEQNIESISSAIKSDLLSKNKADDVDLVSDSNDIKSSLLAKNKPSNFNIEDSSEEFRKDNLSSNKSANIDLEKISETQKNNLLSQNIENANAGPKDNSDALLSKNTPNKDAFPKDNSDALLSKNTPNKDAFPKDNKDNLITKNTPNSNAFPQDNKDVLLSRNAPNQDAFPKDNKDALLSKNAPNQDAVPKDNKDNLISKNTPNSDAFPKDNSDALLSKNIPNTNAFPQDNKDALLSKNVPNNSDLEKDSKKTRNDLLSKNVSNPTDLFSDSISTLNNNINNNVPSNLNISATAEAQKNTLMSKNVPNETNAGTNADSYRDNQLVKNGNSVFGTNVSFGGSSMFLGVSNLEIQGKIFRGLNKVSNKISNAIFGKTDLQSLYGTDVLSGGILPKAKITDAIQLYNVQNSTYSVIRGYSDPNSAKETLTNHNNEWFQEMLSQELVQGLRNRKQTSTNTTSASVISSNRGKYLSDSPEKLLKPINDEDVKIGTAESMMSQTLPSEILRQDFYNYDSKRGVLGVIDKIKNSGIKIAQNFKDGNTEFVVGVKPDGSDRITRTRYTLKNKYAPVGAGVLDFAITNYSMQTGKQTMRFPPYIKSFSHNDTANWNTTSFLGRAEPIYTYGTSSRGGSISFHILTDYADEVNMGFDYDNSAGESITSKFEKHFTVDGVKSNINVNDLLAKRNVLAVEASELNNKIIELKDNNVDISGISDLQAKLNSLRQQKDAIDGNIELLKLNKDTDFTFSETNSDFKNGNLYNLILDQEDEEGRMKTSQFLDQMKEKLYFQPAYFSGDKVDYINRMEFVSKLTRPARNTNKNSSFSFTRPPVAHIRIGTFFDYDVVVGSVRYSYDPLIWSFMDKDGKVQPLYTTIDLDFNIVGPFGGFASDSSNRGVALSTDDGGIYQPFVE